ncbi:MAG TPA: ABC transporter permease [Verrucomicrobiae bacterium]|jgi:osmoprotectant transport system permease protein|nr:ABC transporter permease [Verrucomicrobiae bacterium]
MLPGQQLIDFSWIGDHLGQIAERIGQHLELTILPVAIGFLIALVLSIWAIRQPIVYGPITVVTGVLYTIPSLAAFAVLIRITGLSLLSALIPLVSYTLLILVRNIVAGFRGVPPEVLEAAEGMGYTRTQRLIWVEIPLAVPMMITGLRLATVTAIGLATVASIIGGDTFGGLGQLISEGLQTYFPTKYLLGAVLSIVLAVGADVFFVQVERWITPWARNPGRVA